MMVPWAVGGDAPIPPFYVGTIGDGRPHRRGHDPLAPPAVDPILYLCPPLAGFSGFEGEK